MAQTAHIDPTKMGQGRAIAVLTSGGDAQGKWSGEHVRVSFQGRGHGCILFASAGG